MACAIDKAFAHGGYIDDSICFKALFARWQKSKA
jgi:hypothetical protein